MSDRELRRRLLRVHPPDEIGPERRGWSVVRRAFDEREPGRRRRSLVRPLLALALVLVLVAAVVNPPVLRAIRDAVGREQRVTVYRQALFSLPARGRLLVNSDPGPWIVRPGGSRRLLGRYREASWSPHGRFVVALRPHGLVALEPNGTVRWSLARSGQLASPRWSADIAGSTRIAYLRGPTLRVVGGDGARDRLLAGSAAPVVPAWRPGAFDLAYAGADGSVRLVDSESGTTLWRVPAPKPIELAWSGDGRRLLLLSERALLIYRSTDGRRIGAVPLPAKGVAAAFQPGTHRIAVVVRFPQRSAVLLLDGDDLRSQARLLFATAGRLVDPAWAPDSRWLLVGWQSADAFVFVATTGEQKAVGNISRQFSSGRGRVSFPSVAQEGWCCISSS